MKNLILLLAIFLASNVFATNVNICGDTLQVIDKANNTLKTLSISSVKENGMLKVGHKIYFGTLYTTNRGDRVLKSKNGKIIILTFTGKVKIY